MKKIAFLLIYLLGYSFNSISAQSNAIISKLEKKIQEQTAVLGANHLDIARYCDSLGTLYMKSRNYAKADRVFSKALDIKIEKLEESHPEIADSYYALGVIQLYTGAYMKSKVLLNNALKIRLKSFGEKHVDVASTYNVLGIIYSKIDDYSNALSFHEKALNIKLDLLGEQHLEVAKSYINLGTVYRSIGDFEKAITFQNKGIKINVEIKGEQHPHVANAYSNLGNVYYDTGDYEKANTFHNKALKINLDMLGDNHPNVASAYNNLGISYYAMGKFDKAISCHKKAILAKLEVYDEMHPAVANSYNNLGLTYYETNKNEKAIIYYNKALNILLNELGEKHLAIADTYNNLGLVMLKTGDNDQAISFQNKALAIRRELFNDKHIATIKSHLDLAYTYGEIGNFKTADSLWQVVIPQQLEQLKSTYLFLPNDQRIKYSNTFTLVDKDFYSFVAGSGSPSTIQLATNFLLNTKSLALDYAISTSQLIKEIKDTALTIQYEQLNKLNKQVADAEQFTSEECEEMGWDLSEIQEEQEMLAFQMLQHHTLKSKLNTQIIKWQDIQNHLKPNEATIDFLRVYEKQDSSWAYYGIVINKKHSSPQLIRIADEKKLSGLLKTDTLSHPYFIHKRYGRKTLHQILWSPIEPYLKGIKRIHLSPTDLLHRVPFESLQKTDNSFLAEKYEMHYYSTIRDLLKEKSEKTKYTDIVAMGYISYDLEENRNVHHLIHPLPKTLDEVNWIDKTAKQAGLKTTLLTKDAGSEENVQAFVREKAPGIYHFATHGFFLPPLEKQNTNQVKGSRDRLRSSDNPLQRSAIMLSGANENWTKDSRMLGSGEDGILTALEVTALDLQNTDLVVLSACGTGLGNIHNTEGVFGLQRAFKLAGVNHVVASLWDVGDTATKDLMVAFYNNLLQKKQHPVVALRQAKESLKEAGYEPVDWAGFILIE